MVCFLRGLERVTVWSIFQVFRNEDETGGEKSTSCIAVICSLPCRQGRVGVGLRELAVQCEFYARVLHPTPAHPYCT
jgi:hypothetical protein